jgi:hypothetical protein
MLGIDAAIRQTYLDFNAKRAEPMTADEILCDPQLEEKFWARFDRLFPGGHGKDRVALNTRLLRLRKIGEDKGGLPRTCK